MATYASCLAEDGSGDIVTELQPMPNAIVKDPPAEAQTVPTLNDVQEYAFNDPTNGQVPLSATDVDALERWNSPKKNRWRVFATFTTFGVMGMYDGAVGALVPYLETYYKLSYSVVSIVFLAPVFGYCVAAFSNHLIHLKLGQRGIAFLGPFFHLLAFVVLSVHPPYPVLIVFLVGTGFGTGCLDAAWCAWTGNMVSANKVQGFLQACYSLGATLGPLIATSIIAPEKGGHLWYEFFYIMVGFAATELVFCTWAFWDKTGHRYRQSNRPEPGSKDTSLRDGIKHKVTWLAALFMWGYVGAEVAIGGWTVTFMLRVRSATPYAAGISATGFWAGMTVGRAFLGFITDRFGERICVMVYLALAVGLELIFWLVPSVVVSAIAVAFLGFVFGPLFPASVIMCTKLLPQHLHVTAIGFATALGGSGGAIFPFAVGAIAQAKGVKVLQPIIMALLAGISIIWLLLPRVPKRGA